MKTGPHKYASNALIRVYECYFFFYVRAEEWNNKCVNNCLMRALHRGQNVTVSENRAAENSWLIFPKLTNHNCKTCDPPPAMTSLCRRFLPSLYMWECFPHSKNIKIRSSANLWQARTRKRWFFSKELVRRRLLLRPVQVWVAPNRKTTCIFLKKKKKERF